MNKLLYYIKIVNHGTASYLVSIYNGTVKAVTSAAASLTLADLKSFNSYGEASTFAVENKLQAYKYYIIDGKDLFKEIKESGVAKVATTDLYYITNQVGWKLFYSMKRKKYVFNNLEHFYCVWYDSDSANKALAHFQKQFPTLTLKVEIHAKK